FKLLRANFKALVLPLLCFAFPFEVLSAYAERNLSTHIGGPNTVTTFNQLLAEFHFSVSDLALLLGAILALAVATPVVAGIVCRTVAASYSGEQLTAGEAARAGAARFAPLLVASLMVHFLEWVGLLLCILPGIALMAMFVMTTPAIVLERLGPVKGMRRSWKLASRRFWPVLGTALLAGILAYIVALVIGLVPEEVIGALASPHIRAAADAIVNTVTETFNWSFVATLATLLYFDQRIRQEGLDLEVMAASLRSAR
ncbi:MAG TPA: hypothetical protein VED59_02900, partial [Acidimicrobiales bacterium]|nr:hypothetical protein [Acidimicrobiales bacterium]